MKIAAIIQARLGSKRLPAKHLLKINGKPIIWYLVQRLKKVKEINNIILATTAKKQDDQLVEFAKKEKINHFRGSENDVFGRVAKAAKKFRSDIIVDVSGDCPLLDPELVQQAINIFKINMPDFLSTHVYSSYPLELDTNILSYKCLLKMDQNAKSEAERDSTSLYIVKNKKKFKTLFLVAQKKIYRPEISFLLDEQKDFIFIKRILKYFIKKKISLSACDILKFLDKNQHLLEINKSVERNNKDLKEVV